MEEAARIKTLDVLRGLAVLGILAVNAPFFAAPWQTALNPNLPPLAIDDASAWSWFVPHVFFEAKFITLFSMLFGASLYLVGGDGNDPAREAVVFRRVAVLALFGVIHGAFIWYGDVLLLYASAGVLLVLVRGWRARTLLTIGVGLTLLTAFWEIYRGVQIGHAQPAQLAGIRAFLWEPSAGDVAHWTQMFRGNAWQSTLANMQTWLGFAFGTLKSGIPHTLGLMMVGMGLFKTGFLSGDAPRWAYGVFIAVGALALGVVASQALMNYRSGFGFVAMQAHGAVVNPVLAIFVTLLYASALILCVKTGALRFVTDALAPVGRMAFTNYIAQSLIMTGIFYGGRGFGLWGQLDRPTLIAIVPAVWVLQLIWSPLWLRRFTMGPLEWVWRRLSYAKPVAFARKVAA